MEQKVKEIMAKIFNVSVDDIKHDSSAYTIPTWDSLKHIDLILALEKEFGIKLGDEEIPTMINFEIILNTVKAYQESKNA